MNSDNAKLPRELVWTVIALCVLPWLLNVFFGVNFGYQLPPDSVAGLDPQGPPTAANMLPSGPFVHTILEWTAFCVALFTGVFAFTRYSIERDITTPIIGTALFSAGMIDAFHILAADGLILVHDNPPIRLDLQRFIPFTWAISRTFNVFILIAGTLPFITSSKGVKRSREQDPRYIALAGVLFTIGAYSIVYTCARLRLPQTLFPQSIVPRPFDMIPLVLYMLAGMTVLNRFYRRYPGQFSHGLLISVIPHSTAQLYAAFGSQALYDNDFNIAYFLKIVAYTVPLAGLLLDYVRAYRVEVELRTTQEKLQVARDVQLGLLPKSAPSIPGFEVAGSSTQAEAIGGDFFDYVPMRNSHIGIVVADVSGHEIGASILMAKTRAYLRALAQSIDHLGPLMTQLNHFLVEDVKSRWFVTMFFARLDPGRGTVEYAAAGHQAFLLRGSGEMQLLDSHTQALGVLEKTEVPCPAPQELRPGDILLLLTDGILETESTAGEQFGTDRAIAVVKSHRDRRAGEIVTALQEAAATFRGDTAQVDDTTVVVLKRVE